MCHTFSLDGANFGDSLDTNLMDIRNLCEQIFGGIMKSYTIRVHYLTGCTNNHIVCGGESRDTLPDGTIKCENIIFMCGQYQYYQ